MQALKRTLLAAGVIALAAQASAITIFSDDFNSEHGGAGVLNYTGFANWTVTDGSVDLIGNGYFDFYPGNGLYVDLDGSTYNAGVMTTSPAINVAPGAYTLSFMLGGNQRNSSPDTVNVSVATGFVSQNYVLSATDPLTTYYLPFNVLSATTINLAFQVGGGDNIGAILDNVKLEKCSVPDGGMTVMLLGMGLSAIGVGRKLAK